MLSSSALLANLKKGVNRYWSDQLLDKYESNLRSLCFQNPNLLADYKTKEIKQELNRQRTRNLFLELPLEFPLDFTEVSMATIPIPLPPPLREEKRFDVWLKVFENYLIIAKVANDDKPRFLLHCIGEQASSKLIDICATNPAEIRYSDLIVKCKEVFNVTKNTKKSGQEFFNLVQLADQSVKDFALKVKKLGQESNLAASEEVLITKFINGLRQGKLKFELLTDESLTTFDAVLARALYLEGIVDSSNQNNPSTSYQVNKVNENKKNNYSKPTNNKSTNNKSKQSGKTNESKVKKNQCFFCKKFGHWKKQCTKYKKWLERQPQSTNEINDQLGSLHF